MNSLSTELNRLYNKFCEKNKNFVKNNGLVSLVAHSLGIIFVHYYFANTIINSLINKIILKTIGAVVVYDVLTSNTRFFNNYGEDINQVRHAERK